MEYPRVYNAAAEMVDRHVQEGRAGKPAFIDPLRTLTYGELAVDVDENATLFERYHLKLHSCDLGVEIEPADAVQRLRFEHPEVKLMFLRSAKDRISCACANSRMLAAASHAHKVNFSKFSNELSVSQFRQVEPQCKFSDFT